MSKSNIISTVVIILLLNGICGLAVGQLPPVTYPKLAGYVGILHPLVTFSKDRTTTNFKDYYIGGLPVGINIWKSAKIGFSAEFVPFIRAEKGTSKMSNFLFHPGVL